MRPIPRASWSQRARMRKATSDLAHATFCCNRPVPTESRDQAARMSACWKCTGRAQRNVRVPACANAWRADGQAKRGGGGSGGGWDRALGKGSGRTRKEGHARECPLPESQFGRRAECLMFKISDGRIAKNVAAPRSIVNGAAPRIHLTLPKSVNLRFPFVGVYWFPHANTQNNKKL
jgi:hypothetical protein